MEEISKHKKNAIIRHRKNKNLCIKCGNDIHSGECVEDYSKSDNRVEYITDDNSIESIETQVNKKSIETIIAYRKKKDLCIKCGNNIHSGECEEDYSKSDTRIQSEKDQRPAQVTFNCEPQKTIGEKIANNDVVSVKELKLIKLMRPFIIIDIKPSRFDKIIEWSAIIQICRKNPNFITFIYGDISKYLITETAMLKKLPNLQHLKVTEDEYVNYIASSSMFYSYPSKYTSFSILQNVDTAIFDEKYNVTSFLKNINYIIEKDEK